MIPLIIREEYGLDEYGIVSPFSRRCASEVRDHPNVR